jgi:hypothetical protein
MKFNKPATICRKNTAAIAANVQKAMAGLLKQLT